MGAYRTRRPFVWQDEMAEVRNLFRKVAQVRDSGFTGFSLWKDEPTAETLSRNRLRRRRSQYALELTHLNYGESPYDALTHLHNIRGMCSRIQRQNRYVERKKKTYDADLHPALLRRPVTASSSWASSKEGSEKGSTRPVSAPVMAGTPLHYTPSKPTMLYDATHRCPRYKEATRRSSVLTSGGGGGGSHSRPAAGRTVLKPMANNHNWETTTVASSSGYSSEYPLPPSSSITSSTKTSLQVAPSGTDSLTTKSDGPILRRREYLEPAAYATTAEGESTASENENAAASVLYAEVESSDASVFSSSRGAPGVNVVERPLSRMMSKRPSPDMAKEVPGGTEQKRSSTAPHRKDPHPASGEAYGGHEGSTARPFRFGLSASPGAPQGSEMLPTQTGRPPSRKAGEGGRLLDEQRGKSNAAGAAPVKGKSPLSPPSDGSAGLWALRQVQRRPTSAGAAIPRAPAAAAATSSEQASARPATSPTRGVAQNLPKQERVSRFGSSPSANKIAGKKEQIQVRPVQRTFEQELQQVVLSEYGSNEAAHNKPTRSEQQRSELKPPAGSPAQPPQLQQQQQQSDHATNPGVDNFGHASTANCAGGNYAPAPNNTPTDGEENHVMIKHSTDPYADFKFSMLRMIDEEDLFDKQWELEELFQYYMDLNPAVHHEVLQIVISDIRKNIATYKGRRLCYADSP